MHNKCVILLYIGNILHYVNVSMHNNKCAILLLYEKNNLHYENVQYKNELVFVEV